MKKRPFLTGNIACMLVAGVVALGCATQEASAAPRLVLAENFTSVT